MIAMVRTGHLNKLINATQNLNHFISKKNVWTKGIGYRNGNGILEKKKASREKVPMREGEKKTGVDVLKEKEGYIIYICYLTCFL